MKSKSLFVLMIGMLTLAVLATGCASTKQTEDLLSAAGFKMMPETTPAQLAHLQTLPDGKVTMVVRGGKTYYVYPDKKQNILYIGQQAQFDQYQKLRRQNQMAEEEVKQAQMNDEEAWAPQGDWSGLQLVEPVRR